MLPLFDPQKHRDAETPDVMEHYQEKASIVVHPGDVNAFLPTIPDRSISLILTSPPYNLGKAYESRRAIDEYLEAQTQTIGELCRILKDDGSICWQVGN